MNTKQLILENTLKLMIEKQDSLISIREISASSELQLVEYITIFQTKKRYIKKLLKDTI